MNHFFNASKEDSRIRASHIAIYFALLQQWEEAQYRLPLLTFGRVTAKMAKVSLRTYFRTIRNLHDFGYLHYVPSPYSDRGSCVYLKWRGSDLQQETTGK